MNIIASENWNTQWNNLFKNNMIQFTISPKEIVPYYNSKINYTHIYTDIKLNEIGLLLFIYCVLISY